MDHGFTLEDAAYSTKTGLIDFPGLEDLDSIPPKVCSVLPGSPEDLDKILWNDFRSSLKDFVHLWRMRLGSDMYGWSVLKAHTTYVASLFSG